MWNLAAVEAVVSHAGRSSHMGNGVSEMKSSKTVLMEPGGDWDILYPPSFSLPAQGILEPLTLLLQASRDLTSCYALSRKGDAHSGDT